jgi:hypothetical protein
MRDDMPRPSKFTERRRQRVLAVLSAGGSRNAAEAAAGLGHGTLYRWLKRGERGHPEGRWGRFRRDVMAAEAGPPGPVGIPSDDRDDYDVELKWAMWVLERDNWAAAAPPDAEEPEGPVVIRVTLPDGRPLPLPEPGGGNE